MSLDTAGHLSSLRVPFLVQLLAWLFAVAACVAGMMNLIAEWSTELATIQFLLLAIAPILWMVERRRTVKTVIERSPKATEWRAWLAAGMVALTSLCTCRLVGRDMLDLPPAYHDEYSYLFQAKTLLKGTFSVPSHPTRPELFNQMHVLNEGRMASRYYPGTGLWMAPFVAWKHPYWGHWTASVVASIFVFWTGYELGRLRVAIVSGFACALSPGIALFGNLLLAHQPTLMGLTVFVWAFVKWQRTRSSLDAFLAGCGLSFAMLCRPATAAGIGFPFGVAFLYWLAFAPNAIPTVGWQKRIRVLIAIIVPLVAGWTVMLAYHQSVTGSWKTSPYQLYTEIYSPRHVYGFNNVIRGEQKLGPKVIAAYDRWAKNLTPELALTNVCDRWLASWLWTFDIVPLLVASVIFLGMSFRVDRRWTAVGFAILSLHAIHIPYWYAGIMGWHYVFETAPLWCLLLGLATDLLFREWQSSRRWLLPGWWSLLLLVSLWGVYFPFPPISHASSQSSRVSRGISSIRFPRLQYADFNRWLEATVTAKPAIVLIEIDLDDQHVDYVTNSPGLNAPVLRARFLRGVTDVQEVMDAFPDRTVYLCDPGHKTIERLEPKPSR